MEALRNGLNALRESLGGMLFRGKRVRTSTGTVKNLYLAAQKDDRRNAQADAQMLQVIAGTQNQEEMAGQGPVLIAGILLTAVVLLSAGILWRWRRRAG